MDEVDEQPAGMRTRAERIKGERHQGVDYRTIIEMEEQPLIVEALTAAVRRLQQAGSRFRWAQASALHREG